ncbi:hypothetical protein LBMAG53_13080 [Planctomycetota bacterium]|nr:hypothetical protein LBMAG53_13080 [Planctomycetota bacterium]
MEKIKPHLYWIITGAILLAVIICFVVLVPTDETGRTAQDVKTDLDNQAIKYQQVRDRSYILTKSLGDRGPVGVFDPEDEKQRKELTTKFLITDRWKPVLNNQVASYDEQLAKIKGYLSGRSIILHKPVKETSSRLEWYNEYEAQTAELLAQLYAKKALILPEPSGSGAAAPAGAAAPTVSGPDFKNHPVRELVGLHTRGAELPGEKDWEELTPRFRVLSALAARLLSAQGATAANPVIPTTMPAAAQVATGLVPALSKLEWASGGPVKLGAGVDQYADGIRFTITLQGALPALLAANAALEQVGDDQPMVVVLGGTISRRESFAIGERKDVPYERAEMKIELLMLDFSKSAAPAQGSP